MCWSQSRPKTRVSLVDTVAGPNHHRKYPAIDKGKPIVFECLCKARDLFAALAAHNFFCRAAVTLPQRLRPNLGEQSHVSDSCCGIETTGRRRPLC